MYEKGTVAVNYCGLKYNPSISGIFVYMFVCSISLSINQSISNLINHALKATSPLRF